LQLLALAAAAVNPVVMTTIHSDSKMKKLSPDSFQQQRTAP